VPYEHSQADKQASEAGHPAKTLRDPSGGPRHKGIEPLGSGVAGAPGRQAPETASGLDPGRLQKPIGLFAPDHGAAFVSMQIRDVCFIAPGDNHKPAYDACVPTFGPPARRDDDCRRRQRAFSYPALDKPSNVWLEEFRGHGARIVHEHCDKTMTRSF